MTKCLMKPQETPTQQMNLVLPNPTTTRKSTTFVQKLIAVSISNITYLRGLFPETDYVDRQLEGLPLKILTEKKDVASSAARELIQWVKGALDAFDKKYLRQLILYVCPNDEMPDGALESYTFSFTYKEEGDVIISSTSTQQQMAGSQISQQKEAQVDTVNLHQSIVKLLRNNCILTQTMKSLPSEVMLAMKLLYYDEVTPDDYEPPHFQKAQSNTIEFVSKPLQIKNGKVSTPFHSVKLNTKAVRSSFQNCDPDSDKEEEVTPEVEPTKEKTKTAKTSDDTKMEVVHSNTASEPESMDCIPTSQPTCTSGQRIFNTPLSKRSQPLAENKSPSQGDIPMMSPAQPASAVLLAGSAFEDDRSSCADFRNAIVHCPCGVSRESGLQLLCQVCLRWNHAPCYRILKQQDCPVIFYCIDCHDPADPNKQCNDLTLVPLTTKERQELCLYRHVLSICMETWHINAELIVEELRIPLAKAEQLIQRLDEETVFKAKKGVDKFHVVNKRFVNTSIKKKYFSPDATHDDAGTSKETQEIPNGAGSTPVKVTHGKRNLQHLVEDSKDVEAEAQAAPSKRQKASRATKRVRILCDDDKEDNENKPRKVSRSTFRK